MNFAPSTTAPSIRFVPFRFDGFIKELSSIISFFSIFLFNVDPKTTSSNSTVQKISRVVFIHVASRYNHYRFCSKWLKRTNNQPPSLLINAYLLFQNFYEDIPVVKKYIHENR
jgi:hypothetical protein